MASRGWIPPLALPGLALATSLLVIVAIGLLYALSTVWEIPWWAASAVVVVTTMRKYRIKTDETGLFVRRCGFSRKFDKSQILRAELVEDWRGTAFKRGPVLLIRLRTGKDLPIFAPRSVLVQLLKDLPEGLRLHDEDEAELDS